MIIGRPIANTQLYVLDGYRNPQPVGMTGELYIGGVGVARGYLHRPELTRERFIADPFSTEPGARLYKTGDLVKYRPDGTLEYLGRVDHQVKIRGYRIELGEIEAQIAAHASVSECVVLAREDVPGEKRLVAYTVGGNARELRAHVHAHLPEYMVPAAFVVLGAMPLTPNGKIDRKALPVPELATSGHAYVAPQTATEQRVAEIWAEVLGVTRVGVDDHFFELGGHSLLATKVISRVRDALHVEVALRALFETPTLRAFAAKLDTLAPAARGTHIEQSARHDDLPLSFAEQRMWILDQLEPGSPLYNIPTAVRWTGALDAATLERSVNAIVARHATLRTTFAMRDNRAARVIADALAIDVALVDLRAPDASARTAELHRLAAEQARRPFDLATGPLLRIHLFRLADDEHVLLLVIHHIVSDGWSASVFWSELGEHYRAFSTGNRPSCRRSRSNTPTSRHGNASG